MMAPVYNYLRDRVAMYNLNDIFPDGSIVYDKESDAVFTYSKKLHKNLVKSNPNNYRIAHKGEYPLWECDTCGKTTRCQHCHL